MSAKKKKSTTKHILIAEDEIAIAQALQLKLKGAGFEVSIACNGEDALKMIVAKKYDLALLDLIMPKMDGFTVLEKLKEQKVKVPVIIASNLSQNEDLERAKKLGAVDFFVKSDVSLAEIVTKVKIFFK